MAKIFNVRNMLIAATASWGGMFAHQYINEHANDETGTIVDKSNYEIMVDINGDNHADRVIKFYEHFYGDAFYNYAQVGNKISYNNTWKQDTLSDVGISYNQIRKINGKNAKEILKQSAKNNGR